MRAISDERLTWATTIEPLRKEATRIAAEASRGKQPIERIWVNVLHAADGAWGIAGKALTNQQLGEVISQG